MRSLRLSLLLLVVGFIGVVAGSISWMVGIVGLTTGSQLVIDLAPPIGYGLIGIAWWQWTPAAQTGSIGATAMRRSSQILAMASAITALTYLALVYGNLRFRNGLPHHGAGFYVPHWNLHLVGYAATGVGFLIAGLGFWIGSTASQHADPAPLDSGLARVVA